jgi:hypothetical protein
MDPFLETNPWFHELHTNMLSAAQGRLQPQLLPKYVACLEHHLTEGSEWAPAVGALSLERKEPDLTLLASAAQPAQESTAVLPAPALSYTEELDPDEVELRKQRRLVIYLQEEPRTAVASIELLSPSNKRAGSVGHERYLAKRSSALVSGLHWIEIDLLRGGARMPLKEPLPEGVDYLASVAQATPTGWKHGVYTWRLREPLPPVPVPLLGSDLAQLDLAPCFREAYDWMAAGVKVRYASPPPPPPLRPEDDAWVDGVLRAAGLRR